MNRAVIVLVARVMTCMCRLHPYRPGLSCSLLIPCVHRDSILVARVIQPQWLAEVQQRVSRAR